MKPGNEQLSRESFGIVNPRAKIAVATESGWTIPPNTITEKIIGWDLRHRVRDWEGEQALFITLADATFDALEQPRLRDDCWLMAGGDSPVFYGEEDTIFDKMEVYKNPFYPT